MIVEASQKKSMINVDTTDRCRSMLAGWDGQLCNKWGAGVAGFFFAGGGRRKRNNEGRNYW